MKKFRFKMDYIQLILIFLFNITIQTVINKEKSEKVIKIKFLVKITIKNILIRSNKIKDHKILNKNLNYLLCFFKNFKKILQ